MTINKPEKQGKRWEKWRDEKPTIRRRLELDELLDEHGAGLHPNLTYFIDRFYERYFLEVIGHELTESKSETVQSVLACRPEDITNRRGRDNLYDTPMGMMDMTEDEVWSFNSALEAWENNIKELK